MNSLDLEKDRSCSLLWRHLCLGRDNEVSPCCRFESAQSNPAVQSDFSDLKKIHKSEFFENLRVQMEAGKKIYGCKKCGLQEATGTPSLRQISNRIYPRGEAHIAGIENVEFLELFTGYACNLKCVMCGPKFSSSWNADARALGWKIPATEAHEPDYDRLWPQLPRLKTIKFVGGEPLYSKRHDRILNGLTDTFARQIELVYFTNCTVRPSAELKNQWRRFRSIRIHLSIDGFEAVNDYVRFPSKWNDVQGTAAEFLAYVPEHHSFQLAVNSTVSAYNVFSIDALAKWYRRLQEATALKRQGLIYFNILSQPKHLSIQVLPESLRDKALFSLDTGDPSQRSVARTLIGPENGKLNQFVDYTRKLDGIRGANVSKAIPELAPLFEN